MAEIDLPRPVVTVATIAVRDDAFLCVEERTRAGVRINQPAGHLEAGETLAAAAARETLEETRYRVTPVALVGIYRWRAQRSAPTFVRFCFLAEVIEHDPSSPLDEGIMRAAWLTRDALVSRCDEHRSPLVMRCIDDYLAGVRWPLDLVSELA